MKTRNSPISFGLSDSEQDLLTALYDAFSASRALPAWLTDREHAESVARLLGAGLISENLRLTLQGLAVAVNLPKRAIAPSRFAA